MNIKLLRHPIPYEEETLYSYLYRLAQANRCPIELLIEKFDLELQYKKKTINLKINDATIENIALASNQDIKIIQQMVLDKYDANIVPTTVFLDKEGNKFYVHQGLMRKNNIETILNSLGVK